jgi:hypothetical protein
MSEKPESEEFEDEEDDGGAVESDDLAAWRRLERIREERQTAEQLSDFDDYEIGDGERKPKRNK